LRELSLQPADVEAPREALLLKLSNGGASPEDAAAQLARELGGKLDAMAGDDEPLKSAAERTRQTVEQALAKFAGKVARRAAERDATLAARIDKLQASLFPDGAPQERVHALPSYAARFGLAALKSAVLSAVSPGEHGVKDLAP
jgi:hypothetical protein